MFGFGKGKVDIQLSKYNFSPGETIQGTVTLKLNKSIKAKGFNIRLICERKITKMSTSRMDTRIVKVFDFKQPLDKEREYPAGQELSYNFSMNIPKDFSSSMPDGALGSIAKAASFLSRQSSHFNWYMLASLDIPMGFDVSKKVQINVV